MKKSLTIIALAALVMLAGCKKNEQPTGSTKLIAGIEKHKSDSKTSLDGLQIKWTAGDKLYVYDKDAEEGAIFTLSSGEGTSTGEFTGTYNFTNENVAVYPSSSFSGSGGTIVTMTLPAVQTASGSGTFGNGANPMLGVFSDMDNLTLTSLCGVLCLQLTGNAHITAIEIVGGPDDKLNGTFTVDYTSATPALAKSGDDGTNTVRLNCEATLTSTAQKFYVVVPAGTLHGFTMKVYDGDNEIFSKSTTNDIPVSVNTLSTMNELEVTAASNIVDLSTITSAYTAVDGDILTGTLGTGVQISIADGATVTLRSANINGNDNLSGTFHGLNCLGDATIILENNNNVVKAKCSSGGRAGIFVPRHKTLTFEAGNSSGFVAATGAGEAAGIGGYSNTNCGAIVINSGKVTGTAGTGVDETFGDSYSAGIGSSAYKRCDGITINGGQVIGTAYADGNAAGIGTGGNGICKKDGDSEGSQPAITISNTLSYSVKAQKGSSATYFIGGGTSSKCGIVIVGGTTYEDDGGNRGISSSTSLSGDFFVDGNSLIYMPW